MTGEEAFEFVKKHVAQLGEHFDSVQVFCTKDEGEAGTASVDLGSGNWFARYGQVREWIEQKDERSRNAIRMEDRE
jgi:hypothetical protein